jgi:hypothetical protein
MASVSKAAINSFKRLLIFQLLSILFFPVYFLLTKDCILKPDGDGDLAFDSIPIDSYLRWCAIIVVIKPAYVISALNCFSLINE